MVVVERSGVLHSDVGPTGCRFLGEQHGSVWEASVEMAGVLRFLGPKGKKRSANVTANVRWLDGWMPEEFGCW